MKPFRALPITVCVLSLVLQVAPSTRPEGKSITPDLTRIAAGKGWRLINREASVLEEGSKRGIRFDERPDPGMAWLEGSNFVDGTIEVDIKGRDVLQKSFVGIAFRGVDETTHDVIYFRPFNFRSEDPVRHIHAVQYVSHPGFTWEHLRQNRNGIYEKGINPAPDPSGWFHVRIIIAKRRVSVFVNGAKESSLVVAELTDRRGGLVGLWVGAGSDGMFANLKLTPAR